MRVRSHSLQSVFDPKSLAQPECPKCNGNECDIHSTSRGGIMWQCGAKEIKQANCNIARNGVKFDFAQEIIMTFFTEGSICNNHKNIY